MWTLNLTKVRLCIFKNIWIVLIDSNRAVFNENIANNWSCSLKSAALCNTANKYLPCLRLVGFITLNIHENVELFARPVSELELNKTLAIWAKVSGFLSRYWTRNVKKPFWVSGKSSDRAHFQVNRSETNNNNKKSVDLTGQSWAQQTSLWCCKKNAADADGQKVQWNFDSCNVN